MLKGQSWAHPQTAPSTDAASEEKADRTSHPVVTRGASFWPKTASLKRRQNQKRKRKSIISLKRTPSPSRALKILNCNLFPTVLPTPPLYQDPKTHTAHWSYENFLTGFIPQIRHWSIWAKRDTRGPCSHRPHTISSPPSWGKSKNQPRVHSGINDPPP